MYHKKGFNEYYGMEIQNVYFIFKKDRNWIFTGAEELKSP